MISASALLRVAKCPGSEALPHVEVSTEWTEAGTERHAQLEADVLARGVAALPARVRELLPEGCGLMPEQVVYYDTATGKARVGVVDGRTYEPTPTEIPGRIDLVALMRGRAVVCDWKGRRSIGRPSQSPQLLFYALCVARLFGLDEVTLAVAYIGDGVEEAPCSIETVDALDLDAFASRLPAALAAVEEQRRRDVPDVQQGEWCGHCPARQHCPANVALARRVISGDAPMSWRQMLPLDAERAAHLRVQIDTARKLLTDLDDAVKACVVAEPDQRIKLANGNWYGQRVSHVEEVNGLAARGVITRMLSAEHADAATEFSTTKKSIKAAVAAYAKEHGLKAAPLEREVLEQIRIAGGVETKERKTITEFADKTEEHAA